MSFMSSAMNCSVGVSFVTISFTVDFGWITYWCIRAIHRSVFDADFDLISA